MSRYVDMHAQDARESDNDNEDTDDNGEDVSLSKIKNKHSQKHSQKKTQRAHNDQDEDEEEEEEEEEEEDQYDDGGSDDSDESDDSDADSIDKEVAEAHAHANGVERRARQQRETQRRELLAARTMASAGAKKPTATASSAKSPSNKSDRSDKSDKSNSKSSGSGSSQKLTNFFLPQRAPMPLSVSLPVPTPTEKDKDNNNKRTRQERDDLSNDTATQHLHVRKTGNKRLAADSVPPKPAGFAATFASSSASSASAYASVSGSASSTVRAPVLASAPASASASLKKQSLGGRPFRWRLTLTNAQSLLKFLSGIFRTVPKMRLYLEHTEQFQGFRLYATDASTTLVCNSAYSCSVDTGVDECGVPLSSDALNAEFFCVASENFRLCLACAAAEKETNLTITRYNSTPAHASAMDKLAFEATADTGASYAIFECPTEIVEGPQPGRIKNVENDTSFVEVALRTLKDLCTRARDVKSSAMTFKVYVCQDPDEEIVFHQRISIGFSGCIGGERVFQTSSRQLEAKHRGDNLDQHFEILQVDAHVYEALPWVQESCNEFPTDKVALFLRNMEGEWVQIKLKQDDPLIINIKTADSQTEHTIMVASLEEDD
jgi:hypothetical protein